MTHQPRRDTITLLLTVLSHNIKVYKISNSIKEHGKTTNLLEIQEFAGGGNLGFIWEMKPSDTKVKISHNSLHTVKLSSGLPTDTVDSKSSRTFKKRLAHLKKKKY